MPHDKRKVRKQRGSRTHGWGTTGQHRGKGMRGGHGKAGREKHKWTHVVKYQPDYFGKHGFTRPWVEEAEVMNVGELDYKIEKLVDRGIAKKLEEGISVDLRELEVEKLLGSGRVTHSLIVRVDSWSESAARKIEEAGGRLLGSNIG